jgi:hypothetical protein
MRSETETVETVSLRRGDERPDPGFKSGVNEILELTPVFSQGGGGSPPSSRPRWGEHTISRPSARETLETLAGQVPGPPVETGG